MTTMTAAIVATRALTAVPPSENGPPPRRRGRGTGSPKVNGPVVGVSQNAGYETVAPSVRRDLSSPLIHRRRIVVPCGCPRPATDVRDTRCDWLRRGCDPVG